jgi:hypothetical protein
MARLNSFLSLKVLPLSLACNYNYSNCFWDVLVIILKLGGHAQYT